MENPIKVINKNPLILMQPSFQRMHAGADGHFKGLNIVMPKNDTSSWFSEFIDKQYIYENPLQLQKKIDEIKTNMILAYQILAMTLSEIEHKESNGTTASTESNGIK